ncbi:hypothetical protein [Streptomyces roseoverticillatus]|uniref:Uncharacterized protein n=1 Tax=Streptomyces roseoverticillatus TaxID=66429 RepID=A0ABV3J124_9ACTN
MLEDPEVVLVRLALGAAVRGVRVADGADDKTRAGLVGLLPKSR